ncbi:hypothetical protein [Natronococcus wangiae]|uniref:hypothetical protein n=1 Tax=Natronococcus wangiae TaxID=3068275 RepID=UPI00273FD5CB|nr:hypothetical protein [Natronococcus sp. AD5]
MELDLDDVTLICSKCERLENLRVNIIGAPIRGNIITERRFQIDNIVFAWDLSGGGAHFVQIFLKSVDGSVGLVEPVAIVHEVDLERVNREFANLTVGRRFIRNGFLARSRHLTDSGTGE